MGSLHVPGRIDTDPDIGAAGPERSERLYRGLMHAYPRAFRRRYQDEMVRLFTDQLRDARAAGGPGVGATWMRTLVDVLSSAIGEHLRKDRTMAQSLTTFAPTRAMRLLGLLAIAGGSVLIVVFFSAGLFAGPSNTIRLLLFAFAGVAVALAFHSRQSAMAPRLAMVATAVVVMAGLWYASSNVVALNSPDSGIGVGGVLYSLSSLSLWLSAGLYGAISLGIGAIWLGMSRWWGATARIAALVLVVGGPLAALGDDRWGLTDNEAYVPFIALATLLGVFLTGAGWALLGAVLVFGGRSARRVD